MNGAAQVVAATRYAQIDARLDAVETVLAAHVHHTEQLRGATEQRFEDLRLAYLGLREDLTRDRAFANDAITQDRTLGEHRWESTGLAMRATQERIDAFEDMTWRQRIVWLVTGRV